MERAARLFQWPTLHEDGHSGQGAPALVATEDGNALEEVEAIAKKKPSSRTGSPLVLPQSAQPAFRGRQAEPQVHPLGYVEGALWRLVVFPATTRGGDEVPQVQRQNLNGAWEIAAQDDVLAHLVLRAYRRGRKSEDRGPAHHGLVIPGGSSE